MIHFKMKGVDIKMYATYRDIENLIDWRRNFRGNSVTGIRENDRYKVYSYSTLIAEMNKRDLIYFNNNYFSNTTSRLQNIICRLFGKPTKRI